MDFQGDQWSIEKSSIVDVFTRRSNFQGRKVKVLFEDINPFGYLDLSNQFVGYQGDLGTLVAEKLNMSYELIKLNSWGIKNNNGTFTGALKVLQDNKIDIAMATFVQNAERLEISEGGFTTVVWTNEIIYWKYESSQFIYGLVFERKLWLTLGLAMILSSLYFLCQTKCYGSADETLNQVLKALSNNCRALVTLDLNPEYQSHLSVKIHLLSIGLCGAILFWSYSGL